MNIPKKIGTYLLVLSLLTLTSIPIIPNLGHAQATIFKITLLVPSSNPARQSWSLVVQSSLQALGIDAQRQVLAFGTVLDRAFTPAPNLVGKTWDQGGYDAVFIGQTLTIDPDPFMFYHSSQFAPTGSNYELWNNTMNDQLSSQIDTTLNDAARINLLKQWQVLAYNEQPAVTILYTNETVAYNPNVMSNGAQVFGAYHFPGDWPPIEQLKLAPGVTNATIALAQTGPAPDKGYIPYISDSYYDSTVYAQLYSSLAERNDTIFRTMIPQLASGTIPSPGWSVASDNKTWTVHIRPNISWQDGVCCVNATDVKLTFDAVQDSTIGSYLGSFYTAIVGGKNNVSIVDPYTVKFSLPKPYAYFVQNILTSPILPWHILKSIPFASWKSSCFNTGQAASTCSGLSYTGGPVGTGPYKWVGYNPTSLTNHLTRNDLYYFDFPVNGKTALQTRSALAVKDFYVTQILDSQTATSALTTGAVNVLDSQYHLETQQAFINSWTGKVSYPAFGAQEMGFNMQHPIFGTGTATPLGQKDPSKAALAARYVRQAISHAVPRDLIIQQLLYGYGYPGITTPVAGNYKTGIASTIGFDTALAPYDFNLTESRQLLQQAGYFPTTPTPPGFWDAYGVYIVSALVAAVVALSAVYILRVRRKSLPPPSMSTASAPPTSSSTP
jgi:ABC-type transport system substrate-binding protein